jgi:hypothetical protein
MPNQNNFRSNVTTTEDIRYTASRIVQIPEESIFLEEIASSFGYDGEDNVEIHFYTIPGNQIILSTVVKINEDILKAHIVSYSDDTYKNYLRVDLTKLFVDKNLVLIPGQYKMVMNFFSDEIGGYTDRRLTIETISPSRTEVELVFNNTVDDIVRNENEYFLKEFVDPSVTKTDAVGVAEKIFFSGVALDNADEGMTANVVVGNIEVNDIQVTDDTIGRVDRLNLRNVFDAQLDDFLQDLFKFIREEIVINGDDRIQQQQYQDIIRKVVEEKIVNMRQTMDSRIKIS